MLLKQSILDLQLLILPQSFLELLDPLFVFLLVDGRRHVLLAVDALQLFLGFLLRRVRGLGVVGKLLVEDCIVLFEFIC